MSDFWRDTGPVTHDFICLKKKALYCTSRVAKGWKFHRNFPETFHSMHGKLSRGILEIFLVGNFPGKLTGTYAD